MILVLSFDHRHRTHRVFTYTSSSPQTLCNKIIGHKPSEPASDMPRDAMDARDADGAKADAAPRVSERIASFISGYCSSQVIVRQMTSAQHLRI